MNYAQVSVQHDKSSQDFSRACIYSFLFLNFFSFLHFVGSLFIFIQLLPSSRTIFHPFFFFKVFLLSCYLTAYTFGVFPLFAFLGLFVFLCPSLSLSLSLRFFLILSFYATRDSFCSEWKSFWQSTHATIVQLQCHLVRSQSMCKAYGIVQCIVHPFHPRKLTYALYITIHTRRQTLKRTISGSIRNKNTEWNAVTIAYSIAVAPEEYDRPVKCILSFARKSAEWDTVVRKMFSDESINLLGPSLFLFLWEFELQRVLMVQWQLK